MLKLHKFSDVKITTVIVPFSKHCNNVKMSVGFLKLGTHRVMISLPLQYVSVSDLKSSVCMWNVGKFVCELPQLISVACW